MSIGQRLFAHGGIYTISRLANTSIGFLLLPMYAHLIGSEGYGVISLMTTLGTFLVLLFSQGIHGAWFRLRFDVSGKDELRRFETTVIWYYAATIGAFVALLLFVGPFVDFAVTPGVPYYPLGAITTLGAAFTVFANLYERKLQAEQRPLPFALFSGVRTALTLLGIIFFVAYLARGAQGRIEAGALLAGIFAVVGLWAIRPGTPRLFSVPMMKRCLAYGFFLFPHTLASLANDVIDRMLVNGFLGLEATGVYSMGAKVASIAAVTAVALNQAFTPLYNSNVKKSEDALKSGDIAKSRDILGLVARSGLLMVAAVACVSLCLSAVCRELLATLTTDAFSNSWKVTAPTLAGTVALSCYFVFAAAVAYDVRLVRFLVVATAAGMCVNISLNVTLLPQVGFLGAAWAKAIGNFAMALTVWLISRRVNPVPHQGYRWFGTLLAAGVGLALIWVADLLLADALPRFLTKAMSALTACGVVLWFAGVAPRQITRFLLRVSHR